MKRRIYIVLHFTVLFLLSLSVHASTGYAQDDPIGTLINAMPVEQRVAQLFLVTFPGDDTSAGRPAAQLVRDLHVGGVVLRASNQNYTNSSDAPEEIATVARELQSIALESSIAGEEPPDDAGPFVPLFVGLELTSSPNRPGDGIPQGGFTEVPTQMALGATWKTDNVEYIGSVLGRELNAVGVNMLLGPHLDVMTGPRPGLPGDLGTSVFGGDPYWVSQMSRAFTRGVHAGSENRVVVISQHFPGLGASDRRPEEEIATVQKSLEELKRIELPPFFEVTALRDTDPLGDVDGLQTTHIRYRGLQGNIRQVTRPISLDAQNLPEILALPQFEAWRNNRGLLVSGPLGVPSIRRFYNDQLGTFLPRQVAQEAFVAGHDLLFLADFAQTDAWQEQISNVRSTIDFFADRYREDPVFADRVNTSLRRILAAKLDMAGGQFTSENVIPPALGEREESPLRTAQPEIARIAQESATLIFPSLGDLADRLPGPPLADENILIFTDAHQVQDCPDCELRPFIPPEALEDALLQRYGPDASGQLTPSRITSLTFEDLDAYLDAITQEPAPGGNVEPAEDTQTTVTPTPQPDVGEAIQEADWIIFMTERVAPDERPHSAALKRFLREGGDSVRSQRLVVFAMGAPYYLDATEISKLTAYFAFYTPSPTFIESVGRLLFREFAPGGAPPVTVPGINYDLITQLEPDADQIIQVGLAEFFDGDSTEPPRTLDLQLGDTITLRTGVIVDHNGHRVPDGTPVTFILEYPNEGVELPRQEATTRDGVAETTVVLEREGQLAVQVMAGAARQSTTLLLTIEGEEPAEIATVVPPPTDTPTPAPTPTETATPTPTDTPASTPTVTPTPTPLPATLVRHIPPGAAGWRTLLMTLASVSIFGIVISAIRTELPRSSRARQFLLTLVCGLATYILYFIVWGMGILPARLGSSQGAILLSLLGALLPTIFNWTPREDEKPATR